MTSSDKATSRDYQSTEQRQSATIEAVVDLCAEQDPATLTTGRIAKQIGLTQGALFKHFPNKSRLWESVAGWVSEQLAKRVFSLADQYPDKADLALESMFQAHIHFIARHPGIPRLILGELQKPDQARAKIIMRRTLGRYRQKVIELLNLGIQQQRIAADIDVEAAAVLYLGAIQGLVIQSMVNNEVDSIEQTATRIFRLFNTSIKGASHDRQD